MKRKKTQFGFTLIETLVASTILCGSVLTISAVCSKALVNTKYNREYEIALKLLDRQLCLIDYMGIDEFVAQGNYEGEFREYEVDTGIVFTWVADVQAENIDSLYSLRLTIEWIDHNRPFRISIDTMLDGVSIYADTEVEEYY